MGLALLCFSCAFSGTTMSLRRSLGLQTAVFILRIARSCSRSTILSGDRLCVVKDELESCVKLRCMLPRPPRWTPHSTTCLFALDCRFSINPYRRCCPAAPPTMMSPVVVGMGRCPFRSELEGNLHRNLRRYPHVQTVIE